MSSDVGDDKTVVGSGDETAPAKVDPRSLLAIWANEKDEWVRSLVGEIIQSGAPASETQVDSAYELFRQEKGLDERTLESVESLGTDATIDETSPPLSISSLSEVQGVNALVPGSVIEPHAGLTIIYGENGTGKTGYARILKALAKSWHRWRHPRRRELRGHRYSKRNDRLHPRGGGKGTPMGWGARCRAIHAHVDLRHAIRHLPR